MPKIYETRNRVRVHTGKWWKRYRKKPEQFRAFRVHDVGRKGFSQRIAVQLDDGTWVDYGWSFSKEQVEYDAKTKRLFVSDEKAYDILMDLKQNGELRGYVVIPSVQLERLPRIHWDKRRKTPKEVEIV